MSVYIVSPILLGLMAAAEPFITVLLTEKWLPSVPYMQIFCVEFLFIQIHGTYTQALNAKGRSDLTLKIQCIAVISSLAACFVALIVFDSVMMVAFGALAAHLFFTLPMDVWYCSKVLGYEPKQQFEDIVPNLLPSLTMLPVVLLAGRLDISVLVVLFIQILAGVITFLAASAMLRLDSFSFLIQTVKRFVR